jgi:hypothetical protein
MFEAGFYFQLLALKDTLVNDYSLILVGFSLTLLGLLLTVREFRRSSRIKNPIEQKRQSGTTKVQNTLASLPKGGLAVVLGRPPGLLHQPSKNAEWHAPNRSRPNRDLAINPVTPWSDDKSARTTRCRQPR